MAPDRQRWGALSNHKPDWGSRGALAARHIRDGVRVLEIGTGTGTFRELVADRCHYTGADLQPLDEKTLAFDIAKTSMPPTISSRRYFSSPRRCSDPTIHSADGAPLERRPGFRDRLVQQPPIVSIGIWPGPWRTAFARGCASVRWHASADGEAKVRVTFGLRVPGAMPK